VLFRSTDRDNETAPNVLIVNQTFANRYWPNEDPIGKRVTIGYNRTGPREIVGVVGDVKLSALNDPAAPQMYAPYAQAPWPFIAAVVRTTAAPESVVASLRAIVPRIDPMHAPGDVKALEEYVSRSIATPRFTTILVGAFATIALFLSALGLFSVMAYSVVQRRREIGIRMALGAQATDVRSLVLRQAMQMGCLGLALGFAGAFAAARVIESLLFGVTAHDPFTFAVTGGALLTVMLAAAYLPARRATRVDPIIALRTE